MSLINDMLKDLDAQRTRPSPTDASALRGLGLAGPAGNAKDYTTIVLYSCGLVLLTILALPWVMQLVKQPATNRTATLAIPEQVTYTAHAEPVVNIAKDAGQSAIEVSVMQETPPAAVTVASADADIAGNTAEAGHTGAANPDSTAAAAQDGPEQQAKTHQAPATEHQIAIVERPLTPEQQQQNVYHEAVNAVRSGNYAEGARQLQQVLALNSGHHQARLLLANIYLKQQQHADAETLLATGLAQDARHAPFAMLYAQLLIAQTREQEAIQSLQTALSNAGQDAEYHALLAALYQRTGKPVAAVRLYETALHFAPAKGEWWMGLGISQEQSANLPAAFAAYQRALQFPLKPVLQQYIQTRLKILSR